MIEDADPSKEVLEKFPFLNQELTVSMVYAEIGRNVQKMGFVIQGIHYPCKSRVTT